MTEVTEWTRGRGWIRLRNGTRTPNGRRQHRWYATSTYPDRPLSYCLSHRGALMLADHADTAGLPRCLRCFEEP